MQPALEVNEGVQHTGNQHIDARLWSSRLGVTLNQLARYTDIPEQSLKRPERLAKPLVQSRLLDVAAILRRVQHWFDSELQAWAWYIGQPIVGFGNLTAAEVVKQYGEKGVMAVQDYISGKESGGYE